MLKNLIKWKGLASCSEKRFGTTALGSTRCATSDAFHEEFVRRTDMRTAFGTRYRSKHLLTMTYSPLGGICARKEEATLPSLSLLGMRTSHLQSCTEASLQRIATRMPSNTIWENIAFFFQAEDGIRDLTVTGVQTCALPI